MSGAPASLISLDAHREHRKVRREVREVLISDLLDHPLFQVRPVRQQGDLAELKTAMDGGVELPPITVAILKHHHEETRAYIIDGRRRIEAARQTGAKVIKAEVVWGWTWREAEYEAAVANLAHARPLQKRTLLKAARKALNALIAARKHLEWVPSEVPGEPGQRWKRSLQALSQDLKGVASPETVRSWIRQDNPKVYRRWYMRGPRVGGEWESGRPPEEVPSMSERETRAAAAALRAACLTGDEATIRLIREELGPDLMEAMGLGDEQIIREDGLRPVPREDF